MRDRTTILVKAAPRVGQTHGETVCCAGLSPEGNWHRLYPVVFRTLQDAQKFSRWDIVEYEPLRARNDSRSESRKVQHGSLKIVGNEKEKHRQELAARAVVQSLDEELRQGRSLALVRPIEPEFRYERKSPSEYREQLQLFEDWHKAETEGLLGIGVSKGLVPYKPAPYTFKYRYRTADGVREGTCQDWEVEGTYQNWLNRYSEREVLKKMVDRYGTEWPERGMVLAMGTHKAYPQWLINGIIRLDHGAEEDVPPRLL